MPSRVYAVTILLFVCLPLCVHGYATVVVNKDGNDEEGCVTGGQDNTPCKSLHYVLNELSVTQLETKDVTIIVEYSQPIQSINISYSFKLNVTVLGVGQPSLICENNGFLNFSSQNNTSAAISFDGVTFSNCNGYWNGYEWITGYTFLNFDIVSLQNVILKNSSDITFAGNTFVSIVNCLFQDNAYHFGLVYISLTDDDTIAETGTLISNNVIHHSRFSSNIGLADDIHIPPATVGGKITLSNKQIVFSLLISDSLFQNNQILDPGEESSTKVAEIGVFVGNSSIDHFNITIEDSKFANHSAFIFSNMINVLCIGSKFNLFHVQIRYNLFENNYLMQSGQLVAVYLTNVISWFSTTMEYAMNDALQNTANCFGVLLTNVTSTKNVIIRNSSFVNNYGQSIYVHCVGCQSIETIVNASFIEIIQNSVQFLQNGAMEVHHGTLHLVDSSFCNNTGTALRIIDTVLYAMGTLYFERNAGTYGGGIGMYGNSQLIANDAYTVFTNNLALYGGGLYIGITDTSEDRCEAFITGNCEFVFKFLNNRASSSGNNVFFEDITLANCIVRYLNDCLHITQYNDLGFGSSVNEINQIYGNDDNTTKLRVFPGQNVLINSSVYDAFGIQSSCVATVYLQCDDQIISCESDGQLIQLEGPTLITVGSLAYTSNIKLLAPRNISNNTFNSPSLRFTCLHTSTYTLYLDIVECPVGFVYNETACACQCALEDHSGFLCSVSHGMACVAKGYWLGVVEGYRNENVTVIAHCRYLYCNRRADPCPNIVGQDASSYLLVGLSQNDQCEKNHGGILCSNCRDGATFSFEGLLCIENERCEPWQPYMLLILVILFQFILSYTIQLFLSIQTFCGIGFLSGPLFYLAVVNNLPLAYFEEYYHLKTIVSFFTSVFLLNMEVFGQVHWCFFSALTSLENYAFHYLGPLIVSIVVIVTVLIARKCPKLQNYLHISPIQTICLLLLLSFWSLSDTNIRILQIVKFPGSKHIRVALQPDLQYFTGSHIPLAILAILINFVVLLPFILLMLLAPFVSKKISLYRIQPLLDQFQSSYKDNYRWYPAVYMIGWIIILSSRNETLVIQTVLAVMLSMFFILQPYSTKWLNITNSLLVLDLVMITALLNEQNNPFYDYTEKFWVKPVIIVLIYLLAILPLMYIVGGMVYIVILKLKLHTYLKRKFWPSKFDNSNKFNDSTVLPNNVADLSSSTDASLQFSNIINTKRVSRQLIQITDSGDQYREPLLQDETGYGN